MRRRCRLEVGGEWVSWGWPRSKGAEGWDVRLTELLGQLEGVP